MFTTGVAVAVEVAAFGVSVGLTTDVRVGVLVSAATGKVGVEVGVAVGEPTTAVGVLVGVAVAREPHCKAMSTLLYTLASSAEVAIALKKVLSGSEAMSLSTCWSAGAKPRPIVKIRTPKLFFRSFASSMGLPPVVCRPSVSIMMNGLAVGRRFALISSRALARASS